MPFGDIGTFEYWNASLNRPALRSGVGGNGKAYLVSVAGTTSLDGTTNWSVGDVAVFILDQWVKLSGLGVAAFNVAFLAWFNSLPTSLPASPGIAWNNGGIPSVS